MFPVPACPPFPARRAGLMPRNLNPWVPELLSWHGHERGGVRVPFDETSGNPLRGSGGENDGIIQTPLMLKLAALAVSVAAGELGPRLIFLVGGPGNGKSEAVPVLRASPRPRARVRGIARGRAPSAARAAARPSRTVAGGGRSRGRGARGRGVRAHGGATRGGAGRVGERGAGRGRRDAISRDPVGDPSRGGARTLPLLHQPGRPSTLPGSSPRAILAMDWSRRRQPGSARRLPSAALRRPPRAGRSRPRRRD